jgi:hypothetical protein
MVVRFQIKEMLWIRNMSQQHPIDVSIRKTTKTHAMEANGDDAPSFCLRGFWLNRESTAAKSAAHAPRLNRKNENMMAAGRCNCCKGERKRVVSGEAHQLSM